MENVLGLPEPGSLFRGGFADHSYLAGNKLREQFQQVTQCFYTVIGAFVKGFRGDQQGEINGARCNCMKNRNIRIFQDLKRIPPEAPSLRTERPFAAGRFGASCTIQATAGGGGGKWSGNPDPAG